MTEAEFDAKAPLLGGLSLTNVKRVSTDLLAHTMDTNPEAINERPSLCQLIQHKVRRGFCGFFSRIYHEYYVTPY